MFLAAVCFILLFFCFWFVCSFPAIRLFARGPKRKLVHWLSRSTRERRLTYQSHCDICHTDYRVTLTSGKIAPKTRYFGWNIASLSQSSISFSNVPPEIS